MNLLPYITSREKDIYRLIRAAVPVCRGPSGEPRGRVDLTMRLADLFHRSGRHEVALSTNDRLRAARAVVVELVDEGVLLPINIGSDGARVPGGYFLRDDAALERWASVWRAAEKLRKEPA